MDKIPEAEGTEWMRKHLFKSVAAACHTPWILDIDTTIKTLFGHQEGAEVGYNPHKPGRPSHAYHAYWIGNLRLLLDVEVTAGNTTASNHAQPGLNRVLDSLSAEQRPYLVRGDCGFGNDAVIREMETRQQAYLFKLRQSPRVKRLLENGFDELKNQWGWGGYTTRDLARCRLSARAVGLIYNWWSWHTRLAFPESRREAITSRPLLLSAIGRSTKHAGQTQLYLTPMHAAQKKVERGIENIRRGLRAVRQTAERLLGHQPWDLLVRYIVAQITQSPWLPDEAIPALAGP